MGLSLVGAPSSVTNAQVDRAQRYRLGVLGSGKGSNFVAIAEACVARFPELEVAIVLADVPDAGILNQARERGITAQHIPPGQFRTKLDEAAESAYIGALKQARVEWVVLAGFMRILKGEFLRAFPQRVVNIHPSLLPAFPGLQAWKQALEYGVKVTGGTVHLVDQGVDTGPIVAQQTVPILDHDTPETLHARIQEAEHALYPRAVADLATGRLQVRGRRWSGRAP